MAQAAYKPTAEQRRLVEQLAAFGVPLDMMVHMLPGAAGKPISKVTLRKYFPAELMTGQLKANVKIAQTLYAKACGGDTASMIFWLKTRARWRESQALEVSGPDGGPLEHVGMTLGEFERIARRVADEV